MDRRWGWGRLFNQLPYSHTSKVHVLARALSVSLSESFYKSSFNFMKKYCLTSVQHFIISTQECAMVMELRREILNFEYSTESHSSLKWGSGYDYSKAKNVT